MSSDRRSYNIAVRGRPGIRQGVHRGARRTAAQSAQGAGMGVREVSPPAGGYGGHLQNKIGFGNALRAHLTQSKPSLQDSKARGSSTLLVLAEKIVSSIFNYKY